MELLSLNVGILNVEPIIRSVLKHIAGFSIKELPQKATLVRMLAEMKGITYCQLAEVLAKDENLTLHSDGTTKFGEHYYSFQISTSTTSYSLGLAEMSTGSTSNVLDTFKRVLCDVELVAGPKTGAAILSKIKNTMSDRHIVEKNFNQLLEDYRRSVLPELVRSWDQMTTDEQTSMATMNNFFCGMHLIVGIADVAAATLVQWESAHFEQNPPVQSKFSCKSESGTVRLIRTACKALSKHCNEQCGVYQAFSSFLLARKVHKNPLATFRGNRFNILFYDAGALYYIAELVKAFFKDVWQTPNQLLRAVNEDIRVPEYVAGCKALGLINKIVTGPLWRVLESDVPILEMNNHFQTMVVQFDMWALDASDVVSGEAILFPDFPPSEDVIWQHLITPSEHDSLVLVILQTLFHAFSALVTRLVDDHLPGGKYDEPTSQLLEETASVPKTNVISERDFAKLDRLLREKPNASTLSLEAMILFSNNRTASWLSEKSADEIETLLQQARTSAPKFKRLYRDRREQIAKDRAQILRAKEQALQAARDKAIKEKERLSHEIMQYGLWQTAEDISSGLSKQKSKALKVKALKAQLNFRKRVLEQTHENKEIFYTSKNRKQLSVDELVDNLKKLLTQQQHPLPDSTDSSAHLDLVGKQIRHKWVNEDGKEEWYAGRILSLVPGTIEWFNVQYDGEAEVLTLNLYSDIDSGDLDVMG